MQRCRLIPILLCYEKVNVQFDIDVYVCKGLEEFSNDFCLQLKWLCQL